MDLVILMILKILGMALCLLLAVRIILVFIKGNKKEDIRRYANLKTKISSFIVKSFIILIMLYFGSIILLTIVGIGIKRLNSPEGYERYKKEVSILRERTKKKAIAELNKAIESNPNNGKPYYNRGSYYYYQGNYAQSILDYTKAIELGFNTDMVYRGRGDAYIKQGDIEKAISDYSRVIQFFPQKGAGYIRRAEAYFSKSEYTKSWEDVYKAEALGYQVFPGFINKLKKASGREK